MISTASKAIPELQFWLQSSTSASDKRFVDSNFDGRIDGSDMTNGELGSAGVAKTYMDGRNQKLKEVSPWDADRSLWNDGADPFGRISLNATSSSLIHLTVRDRLGRILFEGNANAD